MPNWCNNSITIKHKDPAMIDRVMNSKDGLLMEFLPTPQELTDTVAGFLGEDQRAAHEAQQASNIEKYGYKDWYDWNVANWGTKWDVSFDSIEREDANTVRGSFDSAWAPPVRAYETLCAMGFAIEAYYNEPGMCFCGKWTGFYEGDAETGDVYTDDDFHDYSGETSKTVRKVIGSELDIYFGISEDMAQWEEEDKQADD
jgi:Ferredoxin-like domain in Api92-like protein